jgi:hypothetical protein
LLADDLGHGALGQRMRPLHCPLGEPPAEHLLELLDAGELAAIEQIALDEPEGAFLLALITGHPARGDVHREAVVGGAVHEAHVEDRLIALPTIHDAWHRIGDALLRDAAEALEASLQTPEDRRLPAVVPGLERARSRPT